MYEIWLAMNIVYEIALGIWPLLALLLVVWLAMLVAARGRLGARQAGCALLLGGLVTVALFFSVPALTQSSFANMGYWVDWANLLAIALGLGALAAVFSLPLFGLVARRR